MSPLAPPPQPITAISSMAVRHLLVDLTSLHVRDTSQRVDVVSVGGVEAVRRIEAGEAFDFVVRAAEAIDRLIDGKHLDAASRTALTRSGIAVAVRAGASRPDISSESALRHAVLNAARIGYSTGPSGTHLARLFERWGIATEIAPRLVQAAPGVPVGTLLARGDIELGFQQRSELLGLAGIEIVGSLPAECQATTVFSAAITTRSPRASAARAFLAFAASPSMHPLVRKHGMEAA